MRLRILLAIVSVTAVAVILFGVPLAFALSDLYHEQEVNRLARAAADAAEQLPAASPSNDRPVELPQSTFRRVALYGIDGHRLAGRGPRTADAVVRAALHGDVRDADVGDALVVGTPVTRSNGVAGALRVEVPRSLVSDRARTAILVMAGIGALVVAVSAVFASWQARRLARPVDRLARAAKRLGDGDFTVRSEPSGVPEVDAVSAALSATAARLDQMLTRERTFSEDASHQLRTPLTGLRIGLEGARLDPSTGRAEIIDTALIQVDRLERTIDDLLTLAREVPTDRPQVDLRPVLTSLDDVWRGRLASDGRPLRVIVDPELPAVKISDRSMRQVLDVLVDNAWRHGSGEIVVHARGTASGVVVEVTDEGDGVEGDTERIFQRTVSGSTHHGIGLALARSLAEADGLRLSLVDPGPRPVFAVFVPTSSP
jgi:signal transduction histidine kinase